VSKVLSVAASKLLPGLAVIKLLPNLAVSYLMLCLSRRKLFLYRRELILAILISPIQKIIMYRIIWCTVVM
jgi:hypothetical protein